MKLLSLFLLGCMLFTTTMAKRPYNCGFYSKNFKKLKKNYDLLSAPLHCKSGETIASIGAGNGYIEMQIACFVDNINWYIQDIDSGCLNTAEFARVKQYHEKLKGSPINGSFHLVLGDTTHTNLPDHTFDRVLMVNVYHELTQKAAMLKDVQRILKPSGVLVIMEDMSEKPGDKNPGCSIPKLQENAFLQEMQANAFVLDKKIKASDYAPSPSIRYYTFHLAKQ